LGSLVGEQCPNFIVARLDPTEANVVAKIIQVGCSELTLGRAQGEVGVADACRYRTQMIGVGSPRLAEVDNVLQIRACEVVQTMLSLEVTKRCDKSQDGNELLI